MDLKAFRNKGQFFKGNIHTHSDVTDGAKSPQEVCTAYADQGYDFICISDHFIGMWDHPIVDTTPYRTNQFTTLLGAELHSGAQENGELWHILAVGLPADYAPGPATEGWVPHPDQETGAETAQRARDAGAFVVMAHPHWSGLSPADMRGMEAAHAVECFNSTCGLEANRGYAFQIYETMLSEGRMLNLTASDDAHFHHADAFRGWVMVKAEDNTPKALLAALKEGAYYSTQGPELHDIRVHNGEVSIKCSAVNQIYVQGQGARYKNAMGDGMCEVTLPLDRFEPGDWARVTIRDENGKDAWSNPFVV